VFFQSAIGVTEVTDALVVVVSEETGSISVSVRGQLFKGLTTFELREKLGVVFTPGEKNEENVQEQAVGKGGLVSSSDIDMDSD
jgi:diadenylate cyclase